MEIVERFRRVDNIEKASSMLKINIVKAYANSASNVELKNSDKATHLKRAVLAIFFSVLSLIVFSGILLIDKSSIVNDRSHIMCNDNKDGTQQHTNTQQENQEDLWDSPPPPPKKIEKRATHQSDKSE